jgi:dTDP-4-amino-4,6-dideoxygalactose transaminase
MIPFFGVDRQYKNLREEILDVTDSVYASGQVLDGTYTKNFEQTIAKLTHRKYAIAVNSCTQALIFALRAIDHYSIIRKNKILIPAQSFAATVNVIVEAGFEPVFCDVDPISGLIDINTIPVEPDDIAAVMYVNLFGNIIDYDKLTAYTSFFNQYKIPIIEDAAQSFGAYYRDVPSGKLGDISCLSFDPTKNLPNYGSGGMILTDDPEIALLCYNWRDNGKISEHSMSGTNSKMSEVDCAQMLIKLKYFDDWQQRRQLIAEYYTQELSGPIRLIPIDGKVVHAWHKFVMHYPERSRLFSDLQGMGIETKIHYTAPLHLMSLVGGHDVLAGAEEFSKTCLSLPIYPEMTYAEVEAVVDAVKECTW